MSTNFPVPTEKRYAQYPRRWGMEYHFIVGARRKKPDIKSACATLHNARKHAGNAVDLGYCNVVRIFDHMLGEYVHTYKATTSEDGVRRTARHPGYVK